MYVVPLHNVHSPQEHYGLMDPRNEACCFRNALKVTAHVSQRRMSTFTCVTYPGLAATSLRQI